MIKSEKKRKIWEKIKRNSFGIVQDFVRSRTKQQIADRHENFSQDYTVQCRTFFLGLSSEEDIDWTNVSKTDYISTCPRCEVF